MKIDIEKFLGKVSINDAIIFLFGSFYMAVLAVELFTPSSIDLTRFKLMLAAFVVGAAVGNSLSRLMFRKFFS